MANHFRDFVQPVQIIFDRLTKRMQIKGALGNGAAAPPTPEVKKEQELPEYECDFIRDSSGKVIEIHYGLTSSGYVWKQEILRNNDGKVTGIKETLPGDAGGTITIIRDNTGEVTKIDYV